MYLILDNLKVHHGQKVRAWQSTHEEQIEVHYLSSYSPELTPHEYLNGVLKGNIHQGLHPKSHDALMYKVRLFMRKLSRRPQKFLNFFKHPKVIYAA